MPETVEKRVSGAADTLYLASVGDRDGGRQEGVYGLFTALNLLPSIETSARVNKLRRTADHWGS
jgi:hypothetical protein